MKKSIKKIVAICLAVLIVAGLFAACSGQQGKNNYTVGICQWVEHAALDEATKGFIQALKDKIGEENVTIDPQNAQEDSGNCTTIINQFVSKNVDLIMANAKPALQTAVSATNQIPIVATSITD